MLKIADLRAHADLHLSQIIADLLEQESNPTLMFTDQNKLPRV